MATMPPLESSRSSGAIPAWWCEGGSRPKTVLDKELRAATVSEKMASDRSFTSIDYRVVLTELEEFSRGGFVAAIPAGRL